MSGFKQIKTQGRVMCMSIIISQRETGVDLYSEWLNHNSGNVKNLIQIFMDHPTLDAFSVVEILFSMFFDYFHHKGPVHAKSGQQKSEQIIVQMLDFVQITLICIEFMWLIKSDKDFCLKEEHIWIF